MFTKGLPVLALLLSALLPGTVFAGTWTHGEVRICAEDAGWPPFSIPPKSDKESFQGFNANVLTAIFERHGIPYKVEIRPWKRCLIDGMNGDIHIVLDAASNAERERDYLLTESIYALTPVFFFPAPKAALYPSPVHAQQLQDRLVCGQKGYTYTNFGFDNARIQEVSADLPKIFELANLGRCDIGLARLEVLLSEMKKLMNPEQIAYQRLKDASVEPFYWLINRYAPFSSELKALIDAEMARLKKSGEAERMLKNYLH